MTETGMKASFRNYQEREIDLDAGFRSTVARILPYCAPKFKDLREAGLGRGGCRAKAIVAGKLSVSGSYLGPAAQPLRAFLP